jgi:hypothetical protein
MQILVNSGNDVPLRQEFVDSAESSARQSLSRFAERLTRLEIHFNDTNGHKGGSQDKRCQIEARPRGMDPVSASHDATDLDLALRGALQKMTRLLDSSFGRLDSRR